MDVWDRALEYTDQIYAIAAQFPDPERYGLASQMKPAAESIALNISEGSTGRSDAKQARFLRMSTRFVIETVGALHVVHRRGHIAKLD